MQDQTTIKVSGTYENPNTEKTSIWNCSNCNTDWEIVRNLFKDGNRKEGITRTIEICPVFCPSCGQRTISTDWKSRE